MRLSAMQDIKSKGLGSCREVDALVYQESERLLIKGFEVLERSNGASSKLQQRQLEERANYLQSQLDMRTGDFQS